MLTPAALGLDERLKGIVSKTIHSKEIQLLSRTGPGTIAASGESEQLSRSSSIMTIKVIFCQIWSP